MLGKWAGPGAGPSLVGPGHGCIVWVLFLFLIRDVLDFCRKFGNVLFYKCVLWMIYMTLVLCKCRIVNRKESLE